MSKHSQKKSSQCETLGHVYSATTVPGWFICQREAGYIAKSNRVTTCGHVAHCPACLGHLMRGYDVVFCSLHQGCSLQDYPLQDRPALASASAPTYEQPSLW